jgi:hypothetical protein
MSNKITPKISLAGIQNVQGTTSEMLLDQLLKMLNSDMRTTPSIHILTINIE